MEILHLFVGANVERADNDALAVHGGGDFLVGLELLLLRRIVILRQIEELGAEQSDTLTVVVLDGDNVVGVADVAVDVDMASVEGDIFLSLHGGHQFLELLLLLHLVLEGLNREVVGVKDNLTGFAVKVRHTALEILFEFGAKATNGGNAHRAGKDSGVSVAGPGGQGKA